MGIAPDAAYRGRTDPINPEIPMNTRIAVSAAVLLGLTAGAASAQVYFFVGFDPSVAPNGATPNASAAHASWLGMAGPLSANGISCYDFNQLPPNTVCPPGASSAAGTPLAGFPGASVAFNPVIPASGGTVLNNNESPANGWDTSTPPWFDLQNRLSLVVPFAFSGVDYEYDITFNPSIQGFGMFITGEGNTVTGGQMFLRFSDNVTTWTIPLNPDMGAQFVGFIDAGEQVSRVTLVLTPDSTGTVIQPFISLDDICVIYSWDDCSADFDHSGFVDLDDFVAFVYSFEAGTDDADFDESGFVDLDDYVEFVHAFELGC